MRPIGEYKANTMRSASALRSQIEVALADRIPSALTPAAKTIREVVPTGIAAIDALLDGGLPVGAVTEMIAECSGRTALALSFLAQLTKAERALRLRRVSCRVLHWKRHPRSARLPASGYVYSAHHPKED